MSLTAKKILIVALSLLFAISLIFVQYKEVTKPRVEAKPEVVLSAEAKECYQCHKETTPALVAQWETSAHASSADCLTCHDPALHQKTIISDRCESKRPGGVSTIVSPAACQKCHPQEVEQFNHSKHATTLHFTVNILKDGWTVKGANSPPERATGCYLCHGSIIKDELTWENWPNHGIGRVNPDGTMGTCTSCHSEHKFSLAMARNPSTCGRCHMGPDHPQIEIWEESVHGKLWLAGEKEHAPTCVTCHMAEVKDSVGNVIVEKTHNIGTRLYWEIQSPLSTPFKDHINWKPNEELAEQYRENMKKACLQCHTERHVDNHFARYDEQVKDYNENYFKPAKEMLDELKEKGLLSSEPFDDDFEWEYWLLWHHEGRRMRMGAAMMGPDYAWWHGAHDTKLKFLELENEYKRLIELGKPDSHEYVPGAVYEAGPNLVPGEDVPDLQQQ